MKNTGTCSQGSSLESTKPFRFFNLPSELRTHILAFVVHHERELHQPPLKDPWCNDQDNHNTIDTAIFAANRRMHHEALSLFYATNTFRIEIFHAFIPPTPWMRRPLTYAALEMRNVHVHISNFGYRLMDENVAPIMTVKDALKQCRRLEVVRITVVCHAAVGMMVERSVLGVERAMVVGDVERRFKGLDVQLGVELVSDKNLWSRFMEKERDKREYIRRGGERQVESRGEGMSPSAIWRQVELEGYVG